MAQTGVPREVPSAPTQVGNHSVGVPSHIYNLWTTYDFSIGLTPPIRCRGRPADHEDPDHQQLVDRPDASPQQGMRVPGALEATEDAEVSGAEGQFALHSCSCSARASILGGNTVALSGSAGCGTRPGEHKSMVSTRFCNEYPRKLDRDSLVRETSAQARLGSRRPHAARQELGICP